MLNLFKKKKKSDSKMYHFVDIDISDLHRYPDGLNDISQRKIDGFIIRNVLAAETIDKLLNTLNKVSESELVEADNDLITYPLSFAQVDQTHENAFEKLKLYYEDCARFWQAFPDRFQMDFAAKIKDILETIGSGREALIPRGTNEKGHYNPATFKILKPGQGTLKPHCGNFFHKEFPTFFGHLNSFSIIKDQLSYFVMLSPPDEGGELVLYDIEWKDAEIREQNDTVLVDKKGRKHDLENPKKVKRQYIVPGPGDMIVFAGGQIWHRVAYVKGSKPRYTLGGFLSKSKDGKAVYFWS